MALMSSRTAVGEVLPQHAPRIEAYETRVPQLAKGVRAAVSEWAHTSSRSADGTRGRLQQGPLYSGCHHRDPWWDVGLADAQGDGDCGLSQGWLNRLWCVTGLAEHVVVCHRAS